MSADTITRQCCIVGGGPAGMMLGLLLARAGVSVIVLEKHADFLRDFRGDTIHPSTLEVLHELGMLERFLALPHQKVSRIKGQFGDLSLIVADFSSLSTRCRFVAFIPQWDFLTFLAEEGSRYPVFQLKMRTEATDLLEAEGRIVGARANSPDGPLEIRADLVVGADGRDSVVRTKAGFVVEEFGAPMDVLWFRLSRRLTDPADPIGRFDTGRIFIMLNRGDYWQCGFVIAKGSRDRLQEKGLQAFRDSVAQLAPSGAWQLGSPIASVVRPSLSAPAVLPSHPGSLNRTRIPSGACADAVVDGPRSNRVGSHHFHSSRLLLIAEIFMQNCRIFATLALVGLFSILGWTVTAAEPSFEQTARYILDVVRAFRTAYVLQVVEHTRAGGTSPQEDWKKDAHFLPLPAQFVKAAAEQVDAFEIGLIGLSPLNPANRPKTAAETDALIQLEKNRQRGFVSFVDGDQFKAVSADLALVQSCVDCHNQHPRAARKNFQKWDVMGGLVVRLKRDLEPEGFSLPADPSKRPPGMLERMTPSPTTPPPWVR